MFMQVGSVWSFTDGAGVPPGGSTDIHSGSSSNQRRGRHQVRSGLGIRPFTHYIIILGLSYVSSFW